MAHGFANALEFFFEVLFTIFFLRNVDGRPVTRVVILSSRELARLGVAIEHVRLVSMVELYYVDSMSGSRLCRDHLMTYGRRLAALVLITVVL